jgi:hypothetical protein
MRLRLQQVKWWGCLRLRICNLLSTPNMKTRPPKATSSVSMWPVVTLYSCTCLLPHTSHLMPTVEHLLLACPIRATHWLDIRATSVPLLASSDVYVATGQVLFDTWQQAGIQRSWLAVERSHLLYKLSSLSLSAELVAFNSSISFLVVRIWIN